MDISYLFGDAHTTSGSAEPIRARIMILVEFELSMTMTRGRACSNHFWLIFSVYTCDAVGRGFPGVICRRLGARHQLESNRDVKIS